MSLTKSIALYCAFLLTVCAKAQDPAAFNKVYTQTYLETSQQDMSRALDVADSLFRISETPLFQTKSLMLTATLYQQKENLKKAIEYAEKAGEIIRQTDDYNWQVRVYGFLATQYRLLKLDTKSKGYSEKALELIPRITNPEMASSTRGLMLQELAYYYLAHKNYNRSIDYVRQSMVSFQSVQTNQSFFFAHNEQLLGLNYNLLGKQDTALAHYRKALSYTAGAPANFMTGLIYNGMASVYISKTKLDDARRYLDSARRIANESNYLQLKNEVLATTEQYYAKTKDIKQLEVARQQKDSVAEAISSKTSAFLDEHLAQVEAHSASVASRSYVKNYLIAAAILLLALGIFYFMLYRRKQRRQLTRFREIIRSLEERGAALQPGIAVQPAAVAAEIDAAEEEPAQTEDTQPSEGKERLLIPAETVQKILTGLADFEASGLFKQKNLSLSFLSAHLQTNVKYLSYVINTYRGKDFNNYINELRINYIIDLLNTDSRWRQYKISVLAEEAGYASHKKFSEIFKSVTGMPPSVFIQYLAKERVTA